MDTQVSDLVDRVVQGEVMELLILKLDHTRGHVVMVEVHKF